MWKECQRNFFHFLLLISHKYPEIFKAPKSSVFDPDLCSPIAIDITNQLVCSYRRWWCIWIGEGQHYDSGSTYRGEGWPDVVSGTYRGEWLYNDIGEGWHDDDGGGAYSGPDYKNQIIFLDTVYLFWFEIPPSLPLMYEKASFRVFEYRLTRLMNMDYSMGDDYRLFMKSYDFWKSSHHSCWRYKFWVTVFFGVLFFGS